ncbi:hypothetical protein NA56DRAFT_646284 [Hyaloscypha hepaticicola]|uniref:Uncharacterized protein n=1 Tax=Hyaloscypha hepaticicola TaxID=2082293 RepID=A0A2J6Q304_9HELO|nr:hypothetical protein NA56DRAFT_646284 [Hyaloscypha hepaticicola]
MPSQYSTYLRSSPFVCIVDTLSILVRLAWSIYTFLLTENNPLYDSLHHIVVDERFDYDVAEIKKARATSWIRWLCFILGPLPQAIRLGSFSGVPYTKLFGFGFLSSWLLVEFLILIATTTDRDTPPDWPSTVFEFLDVAAFFAVLGVTTAAELLILVITSEAVLFDASFHSPSTGQWILALLSFLFFWGTVFGTLYGGIIGPILLRIVNWGLSQSQLLGLSEVFLVAFRDGNEESLEADLCAVWCLLSFFPQFAVCLMLYGYPEFYDPAGTVNPGWTGVFG